MYWIRSFLFAVSISFSPFVLSQNQPMPSPEDAAAAPLYSEGKKLLEQRKPAEAIPYFEKISAVYEAAYSDKNTRYFSARSNIEAMYYLLEAAKAKTPAIVLSPYWATAYHMKAYALIDLRRMDEARISLNKAIEISPKNSVFLSELGTTHVMEKNWTEALKFFELAANAASELSPSESKTSEITRAWRGMGYVYIEQNRLEDAEVIYRKCLEIEPADRRSMGQLMHIKKLREKQAQ